MNKSHLALIVQPLSLIDLEAAVELPAAIAALLTRPNPAANLFYRLSLRRWFSASGWRLMVYSKEDRFPDNGFASPR